MDTLQQIRECIQKDAEGKLSVAGMLRTIDAINEFKSNYGYLPNDIDEWYDATIISMKQYLQQV